MQIKRHILDVLVIIIGNIVMSFGYAKLMVPHNIINGGVTSLAMIVQHFWQISLDKINILLLASLLLLVLFFLGKELLVKSLISSCVYAFCFSYFINLNLTINLPAFWSMGIASILISFGYFCCLSANSSTVGMDVLALIIHQRWPQISLDKAIRTLNLLILLAGFFIYGIIAIVLGIIFSYLYSYELGWGLRHFKDKYQQWRQ